MSEVILETYDLCKTYKNTQVVSHVNMKIHQGDIYGFIGSNGAGKSTTLKMITGLIFPSSGEIKLFGETKNSFLPRRIGSLIENPGLYPNLSAYNNMEIKAIAMGVYDKKKIQDLLSLVKLDYHSKKPVKKFSLGMKQRLGIAMALLGNPDLLILDEPINGLDPEGIREIREVIQYLNETKKMTIIISSHILGELSKVATRYGIIRSGKLIEEISAKQLDEKCRNYLSLKVADVDATLPVLDQQLHLKDYIVLEDNEIRIYDDIESIKVSEVLALNHLPVFQIYYQKQDLESYFLAKIKGDEHYD